MSYERHEFSAHYGDMPNARYKTVKSSVERMGFTNPIIHLYDGEIIDGWHRYSIAIELDRVDELTFTELPDDVDIIEFVNAQNEWRRENKTKSELAIIVCKQSDWVENGMNQHEGRLSQSTLKTEQELAVIAGVGTTKIRQAKRVIRAGRADRVDSKTSLDKVVKELNKDEAAELRREEIKRREEERQAEAARLKEKKETLEAQITEPAPEPATAPKTPTEPVSEPEPVTEPEPTIVEALQEVETKLEVINAEPAVLQDVDLHHMPINQLRTVVEPNSLDLIITDPPYPEEYLPQWQELAEFAVYALKDRGNLLVMSGKAWLPEIMQLMNVDGLTYNGMIALEFTGGKHEFMPRDIKREQWKPFLWYKKGTTDIYMTDKIKGSGTDKENHEWGQSVGEFSTLIKHFTNPGQMVCDPFLGGGTTAIAALLEGCKFIGCDIEGNCIDITRGRILEVFSDGTDLLFD